MRGQLVLSGSMAARSPAAGAAATSSQPQLGGAYLTNLACEVRLYLHLGFIIREATLGLPLPCPFFPPTPTASAGAMAQSLLLTAAMPVP